MVGMAWWVVLCVGMQAPATTAQPDARQGVVVLEHAGRGITPAVRDPVMGALQAGVEHSLMFRWAGPPALAEEELLVALGCDSLDDACARKAATQLRAPVLLVVDLDRTDATRVRIRVLHAGNLGPTREQTVLVRAGGDETPALQGALKLLLHRGVASKLVVNSQPAGAAVTLDGVAVGNTPLELDTVAPGMRHLLVGLAGHEPQEQDVVADLVQSRTVHVVLRPSTHAPAATPAPAPAAPTPPPRPRPLLGYGLLAGGGATLALGALGLLGAAVGMAVASSVYGLSMDRNSPINRLGLGAAKQLLVYSGAGVAVLLLPLGALLVLVAAGLGAAGVVGVVQG